MKISSSVVDELNKEIEALFPEKPNLSQEESLDYELYIALIRKRDKLNASPDLSDKTPLSEEIQKALNVTKLSMSGVNIYQSFRAFTHVFAKISLGLLGMLSSIGGFVIQAILTIWDLITLGIEKARQKKIEQEKTNIMTHSLNLGLTIVGILTLTGIISFSAVLAPFVIPVISALMVGLSIYKESYALRAIQHETIQLKQELKEFKALLNQRIIAVNSQSPQVQSLRLKADHHALELLTAKNFTHEQNKIKELESNLLQNHYQIKKMLYQDHDIQMLTQKIVDHEKRIQQLTIKEKYTQHKLKLSKQAMLGVGILLLGTGLIFLSGPLGLLLVLGGLSMVGYRSNQLRKISEAEQKEFLELQQDETPFLKMEQIKKQYRQLDHEKKLTKKPTQDLIDNANAKHSSSNVSASHMFEDLEHTLEHRTNTHPSSHPTTTAPPNDEEDAIPREHN